MCMCAPHWVGGKWECEREAGRVGPAASRGSSQGGDRAGLPAPNITMDPDRKYAQSLDITLIDSGSVSQVVDNKELFI